MSPYRFSSVMTSGTARRRARSSCRSARSPAATSRRWALGCGTGAGSRPPTTSPTPGPVMLSQTAARFVYPDEDAVGRPLYYGAIPVLGIARRAPIVAVVDDMKYQGLAAPRAGTIYVPWPRAPTGVSHLVVRTTGDPMALAPAIRHLIRTLNPSLPVPEGTHAGGPRRRLHRRSAAARPAGGGLRGPSAGRRGWSASSPPSPGPSPSGATSWPFAPPSARRRAGSSGSSCVAPSPSPVPGWRRDCWRRPRPAAASLPCCTASAPTTPPRSRQQPSPSFSPRWPPPRFPPDGAARLDPMAVLRAD